MVSLRQNLVDLATRLGTEFKSIRTLINGNAADLSGLTTTQKGNLVAAINEVRASVSGAAGINDATTTTSSTWSSSKVSSEITTRLGALTAGAPTALDTLDELANALGDDANFAATITTALGNRVRVDAAQTLTAAQQLQARSNIGAPASADFGDVTTLDLVATFQAALV